MCGAPDGCLFSDAEGTLDAFEDGIIDVAVKDPESPEKYLLAVLFDDDVSALSDTVRDRAVLQKDMLHRMGWQVMNLWLLDWWQDKDAQIRKIEDEIRRLKKG